MIKIILLIVLLAFSTSCDTIQLQRKNFSRKELSSFEGIAMTIPYRIEVGKELSKQEHAKIVSLIDSVFLEIDQIFNKWNPQSEISKLNRLKAYEIQKISPHLARFLKRCEYFVHLSHGRFDPTIEPLQLLWKKSLERDKTPTRYSIEALRPAIGWHNIILSENTFAKRHSLTALDFGGIIKGYAVDLIAQRFKKLGFHHFFIEWGGEVRAGGRHPQGRNWAVYIPNLEDLDPEHALAYVPLQDQAIATSGDYMQQWTTGDGTLYCHIFDPQTLQPLEVTMSSIASASVLAGDCMTADALSTMLLICQDLDEAKQLSQEIQKKIPETSFWLMSRDSSL